MLNLRLFFISFFLFFSMSAKAYEPFFTEDASTLTPSQYQLDVYSYNIFNKSAPVDPNAGYRPLDPIDPEDQIYFGQGRALAFPITISRGIDESTEASFGLVYYYEPKGSYSPLANWQLAVKHRFYGDGAIGWNFAVKPYLNFPESKDQQIIGLGGALLGFGSNFVTAYYGENYDVYFNVDYTYAPYNKNILLGGQLLPNNRFNLFTFAVAPVWKVTEKFRVGFDAALVSSISYYDNPFNFSFQLGFMYAITPDLDFVASYLRTSRMLSSEFIDGPNSSIGKVGFSYRF